MSDFSNPTFEKACRYLGWGDPAGHGLWFIGLEEGGRALGLSETNAWFAENPNLVPDGEIIYERATDPKIPLNRFEGSRSQIPFYTAGIASAVSASGLDVYSYKEQRLWVRGQGIFSANLFPMNKPSWDSWPDECTEVSGFARQQWPQYLDLVSTTRHKWLRDYVQKMQPQAVVCFGKPGWSHFQAALKLEDPVPLQDDIVSYPDKRVLLVPFFGRGKMHEDTVLQTTDILKQWKVSVP